MLLQTNVSNSMARGRRTNQSVRWQGNSNSYDDGRGLDIKKSFKQFMKEHKGKEVSMTSGKEAQKSSPRKEKLHSNKTAKEFFEKRKLEKETSRER